MNISTKLPSRPPELDRAPRQYPAKDAPENEVGAWFAQDRTAQAHFGVGGGFGPDHQTRMKGDSGYCNAFSRFLTLLRNFEERPVPGNPLEREAARGLKRKTTSLKIPVGGHATFFAFGKQMRVDHGARTIFGVAIATIGTAEGHGVELDRETLRQVVNLGNEKPIRCRINHPESERDDDGKEYQPVAANKLETLVGYASNFRIDGDKVLADCKILSPDAAPKGNQILALAAEAPEIFGASMVFTGKSENGKSRLAELFAIDFVDVPAANPAGLFAARRAR